MPTKTQQLLLLVVYLLVALIANTHDATVSIVLTFTLASLNNNKE